MFILQKKIQEKRLPLKLRKVIVFNFISKCGEHEKATDSPFHNIFDECINLLHRFLLKPNHRCVYKHSCPINCHLWDLLHVCRLFGPKVFDITVFNYNRHLSNLLEYTQKLKSRQAMLSVVKYQAVFIAIQEIREVTIGDTFL